MSKSELATTQERVQVQLTDALSLFGFRRRLTELANSEKLTIQRVIFNVASETVGRDGTRHITVKPVVLEQVEIIEDSGIFLLQGSGSRYLVELESHGGMFYNDGDQTHYES